MVLTVIGMAIVIQFSNLTDASSATIRDAQAEVIEMFRKVDIEIGFKTSAGHEPGGPEALRLTLVSLPGGSLHDQRAPVLGAATRTMYGRDCRGCI